MADYFLVNYARLEHGFIFLTANYFIAAGVPFVLSDFGRPVKRRTLILSVLGALGCIVFGEFVAAVYHAIDNNDRLTPFMVSIVVTTVYALALSRVRMPVKLMRAASYIGITSLVICTTSSLGGVLGSEYHYLQWVIISVNFIMIASGAMFLKYFTVDQGVRLHIIIPATSVFINALCMAFIILSTFSLIGSAAALILSLLLIFADLLAYFAMWYIVKRLWGDPRRAAERIQRDAENDLFRMSEARLEQMRNLRHELKNQYSYMQVLLGRGEYEKLSRYFAEMSSKVAVTVDYTDCGNSTINAIVAAEQSRVHRAGGELVCRIAVPSSLGISDVDLCSFIMNLVNNAAEYLERKPDLADRRIDLELTMNGHTLLVKVSNCLEEGDAEHALRLRTNKPDKRYHGCGTRIVKSICAKYNGAVTFSEKDGRFVVAAMLTEPCARDSGGRAIPIDVAPVCEKKEMHS